MGVTNWPKFRVRTRNSGPAARPIMREPAELPAEPMVALRAATVASPPQESDLGVLIRLSIPSILATISGTVMSFVDFAYVSQLGSAAQAAVGNASVLVW